MNDVTNATIAFLQAWAPNELWVLSAIDPAKIGAIETKTFDKNSVQTAAAWIEHWNNKRNLYFSVNQPAGPVTTKIKKNEIVSMVALHVDIDPEPPPEGTKDAAIVAHYEAQQEKILAALQAFHPQPTVILFSGGGYQAFWKFREAVEVSDYGADVLESYNKKLSADLGLKSDPCFNIDRIMRLPFTMNLPTAKKLKKGRVPVLSGLVEADWELLYSLHDFQPLPKEQPKASKPQGDGETPKYAEREVKDWCLRLIEHGPDKEGKYHFDGDRSKAVWAVCCELVRCGWTDERIIETISSDKNAISEHVRAQSSPAKYAQRQAQRARETAGSEFELGYKGNRSFILQTFRNIMLAFDKMDVKLSYDEFKMRNMVEGPDHAPLRPVDDAAVIDIYATMSLMWNFDITKEKLWAAVDYVARKNPYHPVRQYLDSLQWDGIKRLDTWLVDLTGAKDTPYVRAVGAITLMAAVRRVRQPGCKFDEMLVLISPQGAEKSTLLSSMAVRNEWFTDELVLNGKNREVVEIMSGKWIVEAAELTGIKQVEHVKAVLARGVDRARKAYAHEVADYPRQCIIIGTTNSDTFLHDTTGNRRFWPVKVVRINTSEYMTIRDQLWAEAAAREAAGESIRLPEALWGDAEIEQERHTHDEPWLDTIGNALAPYEMGKITAPMLFKLVDVPVDRQTGNQGNVIAKIMAQLGWKRTQRRVDGSRSRFYYLGDDIDFRLLPTIVVTRNRDNGEIEVTTVETYQHHDQHIPL